MGGGSSGVGGKTKMSDTSYSTRMTTRLETIKEVSEYDITMFSQQKLHRIKIVLAKEGDYVLGSVIENSETGYMVLVETGSRLIHCEAAEPLKQRDLVTIKRDE